MLSVLSSPWTEGLTTVIAEAWNVSQAPNSLFGSPTGLVPFQALEAKCKIDWRPHAGSPTFPSRLHIWYRRMRQVDWIGLSAEKTWHYRQIIGYGYPLVDQTGCPWNTTHQEFLTLAEAVLLLLSFFRWKIYSQNRFFLVKMDLYLTNTIDKLAHCRLGLSKLSFEIDQWLGGKQADETLPQLWTAGPYQRPIETMFLYCAPLPTFCSK